MTNKTEIAELRSEINKPGVGTTAQLRKLCHTILDKLEAAEACIAKAESLASEIALKCAGYADANILNLNRAEKAETELAALRGDAVPVAYFAAAPDYGWDMFKNKEDAIATCQAEIDAFRDCRDDGWDDDVQRVCWGVVLQKAEGFDQQGLHTSNSQHTYQTCDYSLQPELFTRPAPPVAVRAEHAAWSQATFGEVGPVGPLKHLAKEAIEAAEAPDDLFEWADMQFLFWDAQRRAGISDAQIEQAMIEKLAINKARTWPEPKDGEPRLHVKPADGEGV